MAQQRMEVAEQTLDEPNLLSLLPSEIREQIDAIFLQQFSASVGSQLNANSFSEYLKFLERDRKREFDYARLTKRFDFARDLLMLASTLFVVLYLGSRNPNALIYTIPSMISLFGIILGRRYFHNKNKRRN